MKLSYIFKIRDKADATILAQIEDPQNLEVTKILNDIDTASFFLPFNSQFATKAIIKRFNRVDVYEQIGATETKIFEGIIRGYDSNLEGVTVNMVDFLGLLTRRILFSADYTANSEAVNTTLTNLFSTMNGVDDTGLTINSTDIITTAVDKVFPRGENLAQIIKDLAVAVDGEFQIVDRKLEFKSTIGTDRTIVGSADYRSFRSDIANPNENSINRAEAPLDSREYANAILGKAGSSFDGQNDSGEITTYGRIETTEYFSSGDTGLTNQVEKRLDILKVQPQFPKIEPKTEGLFYQDINIGDLIPIFINTGSDLFSFDDNYKIVKKTLRRTDFALPRINIEFSENVKGEKNLIDTVNDLQDEVKALQLTI